MNRAILAAVLVAALTAAALGQAPDRGSSQARQFLDTNCAACHNARVRAGGVALDGLDLEAVHQNADVWEKALRKLRGGQMPPPGHRQRTIARPNTLSGRQGQTALSYVADIGRADVVRYPLSHGAIK